MAKDEVHGVAEDLAPAALEANATRAAPYVRWLLALAHVWQIEADLRRSRWAALAGGLLVVAGAVLFFIAAGGL